HVAIKHVRHSIDRFVQEAHAIAALNHPNICQIHDVGTDYLVLEFINGETLRGPLPVEEAVPLAVQIADAIDTAHRHGILHRDLKPGNILVVRDGMGPRAKLLDFGLARLLNTEADVTRSADGSIVGTTPYMAPEQVEGKEVD